MKTNLFNEVSSQNNWQHLPFYVAMNQQDPADAQLLLQKKTGKGTNEEVVREERGGTSEEQGAGI